jgi:hypothetical protein
MRKFTSRLRDDAGLERQWTTLAGIATVLGLVLAVVTFITGLWGSGLQDSNAQSRSAATTAHSTESTKDDTAVSSMLPQSTQESGPANSGHSPENGTEVAGAGTMTPNGSGTYLFALPVNSAGQRGQKLGPYHVSLAGTAYAHATRAHVKCANTTATPETFYTGGSYSKLVGVAGLVDGAPTGLRVQLQIWADGGLWRWYDLADGQTLSLDLEISGFKSIGVMGESPERCPLSKTPFAYLGDTMVTS